MNSKSLAPVLITVYDRLDCLKNAVASLQRNSLSSQTDLYIVSDYPYNKNHEEIIFKIREYIQSIKGFKRVEGIFWDKNKGSFDSSKEATDYIFSKYDRLIFLEDDIVVSNRFLEYMNDALEFYKDDERIFSISGHRHYKNMLVKNYPYEVFLLQMYSAWGCGVWKDRHQSVDWEIKDFDAFLQDKQAVGRFNSISKHMLPLLLHMLEVGQKYGDAIICYNMFKTQRYSLFPIKPLSVNRGHDGRGEHCTEDKKFQNQPLSMDFCPKLQKNIPFNQHIARKIYWLHYPFRQNIIHPILKKLYLYKPLKYIKNVLRGIY